MKKALTLIVSLAMVLSMFSGFTFAQAAGRSDNISVRSSAISDVQMQILEKMVEIANYQIEALVKQAQRTPYDDVDQLLFKVNLIVRAIFAYADRIGATVVCEYTEYYIDGRYVLIDPLRVINI